VLDRFSIRLIEINSIHPGRSLKLCSVGGNFSDLEKFYLPTISVTISGLDYWEQFQCEIQIEEIKRENRGMQLSRSTQDTQGFFGADYLSVTQLQKVASGPKFVH
jgi:hypothetical protein